MTALRAAMPWLFAVVAMLGGSAAGVFAEHAARRTASAAQVLAWMQSERAAAPAPPATAVRDALQQALVAQGLPTDITVRGKRLVATVSSAATDRVLAAVLALERVHNVPVRVLMLKAEGGGVVSGAIEVDGS